MGWIGALAVFMAHAIASVASADPRIVAAASIAMGIAAWFVILPMAAATVVTGLIQALASAWGLVRHYWIVFKLLLTALATGVLLMKLGPIAGLADTAASASFVVAETAGLRTSLFVHAVGGIVVLATAAALAVYKPAGLTRRGERALRSSPASTPPWVRIAAIVSGVVGLLLIILAVAVGHGPGVHAH